MLDWTEVFSSYVPVMHEIPWPHAPLHRLEGNGVYFVTAATYQHEHHFRGARRLEVLHRGLLTVARDYDWQLEAWAVFSNHYHFVGRSPQTAENLSEMIALLHTKLATWANRLDRTPGRKVWHNYRETRLTFQKSYLARLKYVHHNAVRHGLVQTANEYPWCSARWFEKRADRATQNAIGQFKIDRLAVEDEYDVAKEW